MKTFLLSLFIATVGFAQAVQAAVWNGTVDISWYNPRDTMFFISTAEQLAGLSHLSRNVNFSGRTIRLTADIWLNDTTAWQTWNIFTPANKWIPIRNFSGVFDGNNHFIYGMYINSGQRGMIEKAGFIGYMDNRHAVVKNLALSHFFIQHNGKYAGGIVGHICCGSVINSAVNGIIIGNRYVGGIVGYAEDENGIISGNLVFAKITGRRDVGGLIGRIHRKPVVNNQFSGRILINRKESRNLFGRIGLRGRNGVFGNAFI